MRSGDWARIGRGDPLFADGPRAFDAWGLDGTAASIASKGSNARKQNHFLGKNSDGPWIRHEAGIAADRTMNEAQKAAKAAAASIRGGAPPFHPGAQKCPPYAGFPGKRTASIFGPCREDREGRGPWLDELLPRR